MLVLVYRKCSTCLKALKWLEENNIEFEERPIKEQNPTIDVYDMASWMSISALAEESVTMGGHPVAIPDFTKGTWVDRK